MAPFGPGNLSPVFASSHVQASGIKIINEKHIKFTARQEGQNQKFEVIAFNMIDKIDLLQCGIPFEMAFTLELNEYMGYRSIQLVAKDIRTNQNEA